MSIIIKGPALGNIGVDNRSWAVQLLASTSLKEWWRAKSSELTLSSTNIVTWVSKQTSTRNATQATTAYQALLVDNVVLDPYQSGVAHSVARFSGAHGYTCGSPGAFDLTAAYTVAVIYKPASVPASSLYMFSQRVDASNRSDLSVDSASRLAFTHGNGYTNHSHNVGSWNLGIVGHDTAKIYMEVNGLASTPVTTNNAAPAAQFNFGAFNGANGSLGFNGDIADFFFLSGSPTYNAANLQLIREYAAWVYGITVSGVIT